MRLSFDKVLELLEEYKREHGNLLIPTRYCTIDGVKLGKFVSHIRNGQRKTTAKERKKLNQLGFVWKCKDMLSFDKVIELLNEYKREYGDLLIPVNYCTEKGINLGWIVSNIRKGHRKITIEERKKLNQLGFVWKYKDMLSFDKVLELLNEYKREHGDLLVPVSYCTVDGIKLGRIVSSIRVGDRKITAEERKKINQLGFVWKCKNVLSFDKVLELLNEYKKDHGDILVPQKYCTVDGIEIGRIVSNIRRGERKTTIEQKKKLNQLGFVWSFRNKHSFDEVIELLKEYKREHGDLLVPYEYCTENGIKLGRIVSYIRVGDRNLTAEEREKLNQLGFAWKRTRSFDEVIKLLEEYKREHGDLLIPASYCTLDGIKLGSIVSSIRVGGRKITAEEREKLNQLGFVWKCTHSFDEVIELLERYKREHGDLLIPVKYCTIEGIKLGDIVHNIRNGMRKTTVEEKARLDELGFVWKVR